MVTRKKNVKNVKQLAKGSPEECYERLLPVARAIPENEVLVAYDPVGALGNVKAGVDSMLAHPDYSTIENLLSREELAEALDLANATVFTTTVTEERSRRIRPMLVEARKVRTILFKAADSAATVNLVPADKVARIAEGRGPIDTAKDCVALAALFRHYEAELTNKTVVTPEHVEKARTLGADLLLLLRKRNSRQVARTPSQLEGDRNRLWTLLVRRHEKIRRVAPVLFGLAELDDKVPALRAHDRSASKPEAKAGKPEAKPGKPVEPKPNTESSDADNHD